MWSRLEALDGVDRLTPEGKLAIKGDIAEARYLNFQARQVANVIFLAAAREGLHPTSRRDPPFGDGGPITTPTSKGRAVIGERATKHWLEAPRTFISRVPGH